MHHKLTLQIPQFPSVAGDFDLDRHGDFVSAGGYSWRLRAYDHHVGNADYLAVFLEYCNNELDVWSVRANFEIRVRNHVDETAEASAKYTFIFFSNDTLPLSADIGRSYGEPTLIKTQTILDEASGFLKNNKLDIDCDLVVFPDSCPIFDGLMGKRHRMHDVTLVVDGQRVFANKEILACYSHYFEALFLGAFSEAQKDEVVLEDVDFAAFFEFFYLVYAKADVIHGQNVKQIIPLADRFRVEWLVTECERYVVSAKDMEAYKKLQAAELLPDSRAVNQVINRLSPDELCELAEPEFSIWFSKETLVKLLAKCAIRP